MEVPSLSLLCAVTATTGSPVLLYTGIGCFQFQFCQTKVLLVIFWCLSVACKLYVNILGRMPFLLKLTELVYVAYSQGPQSMFSLWPKVTQLRRIWTRACFLHLNSPLSPAPCQQWCDLNTRSPRKLAGLGAWEAESCPGLRFLMWAGARLPEMRVSLFLESWWGGKCASRQRRGQAPPLSRAALKRLVGKGQPASDSPSTSHETPK